MCFLTIVWCLSCQYLGLCEFPAVTKEPSRQKKTSQQGNCIAPITSHESTRASATNFQVFHRIFKSRASSFAMLFFQFPRFASAFVVKRNDFVHCRKPIFAYLPGFRNQSKIRLAKTALSYYTGHYLGKKHLPPRPHEKPFGCTEPVRIANLKNTDF